MVWLGPQIVTLKKRYIVSKRWPLLQKAIFNLEQTIMDILAKLDELEAFAELMKDNLAILKKEIAKQGISEKRSENKRSDFVANVKANRARSRIS